LQNIKNELNKTAYLDNDFIRKGNALKPLDELEINLLLYMCYKAKENYNEDTGEGWTSLIEINMKKFYAGIGYEKKWTDYTDNEKLIVYEKLEQMQEKTFKIISEKFIKRTGKYIKTYESFSYFSYIKYDCNDGNLYVRMPEETQKFLMNYNYGFTPIEFGNIIKLKSKSAKLLYLYFRSFKDGIKYSSYTIEHLKDYLGLNNKYEKFSELRRRVLIPAIKEINSKTDIFVSGKHDVFIKLLNGKKIDEFNDEELASIVLESMKETGEKGKSIHKINFRVNDNPKNNNTKLIEGFKDAFELGKL
jgi:plasmid replication initiation protein